MAARIQHQLFFPHPPAMVWEYLTNPEFIALWLMKSDFQPVAGHQFTFTVSPAPALNFDGIVHCHVLEIKPPEILTYSWKLGPGDGTINIDSVVSWHLEATGNGTQLILKHDNFAVMENIGLFNAMNEGWLKNMHKMASHLNIQQNGTTNV